MSDASTSSRTTVLSGHDMCRMQSHAGQPAMFWWPHMPDTTVTFKVEYELMLQVFSETLSRLYLQPVFLNISLFFFCSQDIFSLGLCVTHPPLPLISLGVTLRFGLTWQRRTQARLGSICKVSAVASTLHTCCWDREERYTTIPHPHPHLVRHKGVRTSSEKYEQYPPLPVIYTQGFNLWCVHNKI